MLTKTTKRVISLVLTLILIMSCGVYSFAAVANPDETAMGKFRSAAGPVTGQSLFSDGYVTEYSYYSPLDDNRGSTTKYPVVFMIGKTTKVGHKGAELRETNFPRWALPEFQSRFYNAGGAYIVIARPHPINTYAGGAVENEESVRNSVKAMMEDFINKNADHIDTSRLYLVSWDEGSKVAVRLAANSPTLFAAMLLCSPTYMPTQAELDNLADVPMWLMACRADEKTNFAQYGTQLWDAIKNTTAHSYVCRYTTFDTFNVSVGETKHHETWEYAAYDCRYSGEFSGAKTIDGQERTYKFDNKTSDGVINWLSKIGSDYGSDCTCKCHHATGWERFLWNLKMLISMMLKIKWNRECACGIIHY